MLITTPVKASQAVPAADGARRTASEGHPSHGGREGGRWVLTSRLPAAGAAGMVQSHGLAGNGSRQNEQELGGYRCVLNGTSRRSYYLTHLTVRLCAQALRKERDTIFKKDVFEVVLGMFSSCTSRAKSLLLTFILLLARAFFLTFCTFNRKWGLLGRSVPNLVLPKVT